MERVQMSQSSRLRLVLLINLVMIFGLVVVGLASHSLGVLASGGDYIADSVAIGLGLFAIRISKHPHGHPKATSFVALINSSLLLIASLLVVAEASRRLIHHTPDIQGLSAMLDTLADAASSAAVAVAIAALIRVIVAYHPLKLMRKVIAALRRKPPTITASRRGVHAPVQPPYETACCTEEAVVTPRISVAAFFAAATIRSRSARDTVLRVCVIAPTIVRVGLMNH